jgi:hypothetical protein
MFGNFSQRHSFLIQCLCESCTRLCIYTANSLFRFVCQYHKACHDANFRICSLVAPEPVCRLSFFSTNSFTTDIFRCNWPEVFYHFVLQFQSGCWRTVYRKHMLSLEFFCILLLLHGEETEKCFYFSMCWRCF